MTGSNGKPSDTYAQNDLSHVKHVIGVVSGKGGVGKSMVTGILAINLMRAGYRVGILDADITGPSIPKMFGMSGKHATGIGNLLLPNVSKNAIKIMSANLVLKHESDPVIWRGPVLAGAIRQFWSETSWGSVDYLLVDMPPGTGDVALTVFKSLPCEGVIIVSSPQDLARMIVGKAVRMAQMMNIPVLGLIENMSYVTCPDCGKKIELFGKSHVDETATEYHIPVLGRLPIDPAIAAAVDAGTFEDVLPEGLLPDAIELLTKMPDAPGTDTTSDS
ncbi:MAG: Mrp/NBP35 family ATP-binding protein [Atopobium sp.]|nr:Mrp/NBP35 family ATP-binding protein [Atopobium sp.]MDY2788789.1 Mrp/NBP35 family ATP-binding protein [Atopobium sp.]